jgi:chitin disaccharide deacetylase
MDKMLIVNADDYGRALGVSRGILEAHRRGVVTSTTIMVNQPGVEAQLAAALGEPRLGVGLHLVFTAGRPVLPRGEVPGLVDAQGRFPEQHSLWARAQEIPLDQLGAELRAQADRFLALAGRLPDHLDCHHFVHLYPPFFQAYADLAHSLGLPLRVPFPLEADFRLADRKLPYLQGFPQDRVRGMIVTNTALLRARQLAHPDHFISSFFGRRSLTLEHLLAIIDGLPPGVSELMCHPGYDDPALAGSSYRGERELELQLLTDPDLRRHAEDAGVGLVTYAAVRQRASAAGGTA